jgi:membrane associated rhomboid family serine protease
MSRFFARYPATATQVGLWVLVFGLMVWRQAAELGVRSVEISPLISHLFGDMRPVEIANGQVWRALTATLVHYNLLHLAINLVGLVQLGRMIEEWYGSAITFLVCLAIGIGGNVFSALTKLVLLPRMPANWGLARTYLGQSIDIPSAGGSVIICGLVGLIGVVGWRSRTRFGAFVKGQMVAVLAFTALLGLLLPLIELRLDPEERGGQVLLDNLGHAGGALAGAGVGLLHRGLLRLAERSTARWAGVLASVLLIAGFGAQAQAQRGERLELAELVARESARQRQIAQILVSQELERRERLEQALAMLRRGYTIIALGAPPRSDPVSRSVSRWAYRTGVPLHRTAWPVPWPYEPRSPLPTADQRRAFLTWQQFLNTIDQPLRSGEQAERYQELRVLAARALHLPPTTNELRRFLDAWEPVATQAAERTRLAREQWESLNRGSQRG